MLLPCETMLPLLHSTSSMASIQQLFRMYEVPIPLCDGILTLAVSHSSPFLMMRLILIELVCDLCDHLVPGDSIIKSHTHDSLEI